MSIELGPVTFAAVLTLLTPVANAALFCCVDANGKKVCGDSLPPACIGRDATMKGERGPVRHIEGQLTPERRAQRDEAARQKKQEEEARMEQRRQDQALLNTYISEKDIDVARERAEKGVHNEIKAAEGKIAAAQARRKKFEAETEFYKNKTLPEEVRRGIKDTEFEIKAQGELIESKKKDLDAIRSKFDADKARYQELVKARAVPR